MELAAEGEKAGVNGNLAFRDLVLSGFCDWNKPNNRHPSAADDDIFALNCSPNEFLELCLRLSD